MRLRLRARLILNVVPAKAGTHSHRVELLKKAVATASRNNEHRWLWVPAPVRNCALGRDDGEFVAALVDHTSAFSRHHLPDGPS
ncbi:hypothetical protein ABIE91_005453 [Bradyrhizobium elkanii]